MKNKNDYILISKIALKTPHSQEYLSLLVRRGKIHGRKMGKNWAISKNSLESYLTSRKVTSFSPKNYNEIFMPSIPTLSAEAGMIGAQNSINIKNKKENLSSEVKKELDELAEIYQDKISNSQFLISKSRSNRGSSMESGQTLDSDTKILNEEKEKYEFKGQTFSSLDILRSDLDEVSLFQKHTGAYYIKKIIQWFFMIIFSTSVLGYILGGFNMGFIFDLYGLIKRWFSGV